VSPRHAAGRVGGGRGDGSGGVLPGEETEAPHHAAPRAGQGGPHLVRGGMRRGWSWVGAEGGGGLEIRLTVALGATLSPTPTLVLTHHEINTAKGSDGGWHGVSVGVPFRSVPRDSGLPPVAWGVVHGNDAGARAFLNNPPPPWRQATGGQTGCLTWGWGENWGLSSSGQLGCPTPQPRPPPPPG